MEVDEFVLFDFGFEVFDFGGGVFWSDGSDKLKDEFGHQVVEESLRLVGEEAEEGVQLIDLIVVGKGDFKLFDADEDEDVFNFLDDVPDDERVFVRLN